MQGSKVARTRGRIRVVPRQRSSRIACVEQTVFCHTHLQYILEALACWNVHTGWRLVVAVCSSLRGAALARLALHLLELRTDLSESPWTRDRALLDNVIHSPDNCYNRKVRRIIDKWIGKAARGGHLEVLQWLRAQGCAWHERTCMAAAEGGHMEVLRWCRAQG